MFALDNHFEEEGRIGGYREIVEIDVYKFSRRKYERECVGEGDPR